jgi:hypothetical protein
MSSQSTCGYRASRERLSASPHSVWFVPGTHACTSPPGRRTPSGSIHSLDAATAYLMPEVSHLVLPDRFDQGEVAAAQATAVAARPGAAAGWRGRRRP